MLLGQCKNFILTPNRKDNILRILACHGSLNKLMSFVPIFKKIVASPARHIAQCLEYKVNKYMRCVTVQSGTMFSKTVLNFVIVREDILWLYICCWHIYYKLQWIFIEWKSYIFKMLTINDFHTNPSMKPRETIKWRKRQMSSFSLALCLSLMCGWQSTFSNIF